MTALDVRLGWLHAQCERCWLDEHPLHPVFGVAPVVARFDQPAPEVCCTCGSVTVAGIRIERNPAETSHCGGHGGD